MPKSRLNSIPAHGAFVDALAAGLLARTGDDPLALARVHVLLPNRRAVRALTEAFVRLSANDGRQGLLLPRLTPVGDLGDDSFDRFAGGDTALPPAVPALQRRLELARLVRQMPGGDGLGRSAIEALRLGDALGETLDTLLAEEVPPERLKTVVEQADLAEHWHDTLRFLDIIITAWPPARGALGASDGGTRVAALIDALVARWRAAPPESLVVAAGISGASPPIARLLGAVLELPAGLVVLPGLDMDLSDAGEARWEAIRCAAAEPLPEPGAPPGPRENEEHPQYALKLLLARLRRERADVADWGVPTALDGPAARTPLVMAAMAPADAADGWSSNLPEADDLHPLAGLRAAEAATPSEEAQVIALALREALETPGRTAALVTPDRALARRVAAHCRRWNIAVDDSAGTPLSLAPPGTLALALVEALAQGFAPVALLAVLKHPLVMSGEARLPWLENVRRLDKALRGVRPPPGLDAISGQVDGWLRDVAGRRRKELAPEKAAVAAADDKAFTTWWAQAAALLEPLETLARRRETELPLLAAALRATGDALCGDRLWAGIAGRALAQRIEALEADGGVFGRFALDETPPLLKALLADVAVRPPQGGHPRLSILGPLEAQLQRADLMVLGGLNEGIWPGKAAPDPWLAPAIRARLGLPGRPRETGLAAHDFVRGLGAREVLLTRSRRDASAPLVPSRFWLRLEAFAGGLPAEERLVTIARRFEGGGQPEPVPAPRPAPAAELRPKRLYLTEVDTLVVDPFAFYARRLLRLAPLDPLDEDPNAATRGTRIHGVLEHWVKDGPGTLAQLEQKAQEMLHTEGKSFPLLRALWSPRALRAILWAGEQVLARKALGWDTVAAEAGGELVLANGIVLVGRADRVDRDGDGNLAIIDYKTGRAPSAAQVQAGLASQLGLLAAMAAAGAMRHAGGNSVPPGPPGELAYWRLTGGSKPGEISNPLKAKGAPSPVEHVEAVLAHVTQVTTALLQGDAPMRPQVHPGFSWGDFDHLARVAEWLDRPERRK